MRVVVVGAGVGGLAAAVRLAAGGHDVVVLESAVTAGGKCGEVVVGGERVDTGPSLLTMPWLLDEVLAVGCAPAGMMLELVRVEPVTAYRFADGTRLVLSADLPRAHEALEAWAPGAGAQWLRFLGVCAEMWVGSQAFLGGPPPWPVRWGEVRSAPVGDPRDLLRVRPWKTLSGLAQATLQDPRLRMVVERFASYAGGDPRRAPAALALAGFVEHAFGAWYVRGGLRRIVEALCDRLQAVGGELRTGETVKRILVAHGRVSGVQTGDERIAADVVVCNADAQRAYRELLPPATSRRARAEIRRVLAGEPSLSGYALMLKLNDPAPELSHHTIAFPADPHGEFDDVFIHRRPVIDPTVYVAAPPIEGAHRKAFVLVNAPVHGRGLDWDRQAAAYEEHLLGVLAARGLDLRSRIQARTRRTPADLQRQTAAPGGAIYGRAPHGRMASLRRAPSASSVAGGLYFVGGSAHPGGGLPLVLLGAATVARLIGPADRRPAKASVARAPAPSQVPSAP